MEDGFTWRLSTFINWPSTVSISPIILANAGFKYTGCGDRVVCPICRLQIEGWEPSRVLNPRLEHVTRSPRCLLALACLQSDSDSLSAAKNNAVTSTHQSFSQNSFGLRNDIPFLSSVKNDKRIDYVNGPSSAFIQSPSPKDASSQPLKSNPAVDRAAAAADCGAKTCDFTTPIGTVSGKSPVASPGFASSSASGRQNASTTGSFSSSRNVVIDRNKPDFDRLKVESVRLSTFDDWPTSVPIKPSDLAADGWFYTGQKDRVCCAFCRGILHQWSKNDEPAVEHRKHFPKCPFVIGQDTGHAASDKNTAVAAAAAAAAAPIDALAEGNMAPSCCENFQNNVTIKVSNKTAIGVDGECDQPRNVSSETISNNSGLQQPPATAEKEPVASGDDEGEEALQIESIYLHAFSYITVFISFQ